MKGFQYYFVCAPRGGCIGEGSVMDEYPLWVSGLQLLQPPKIPTSHSVFFDEGPSGGTPYYMEFIAGLYRNSVVG